MKWLVTADLHANHRQRGTLLDQFFDQIKQVDHEGVIVVGDTAIFDGDWIETTLTRFECAGPRLFVPGNHELWSRTTSVNRILNGELRERVERLGWQYLPGNPWMRGDVAVGDVAVVGAIGWYDYAFALKELGIPLQFYEAHVAPGSALSANDDANLVELAKSLPPPAMLYARWNDRRLSIDMPDDSVMLQHQLDQLRADLEKVKDAKRIVAAVHVVPRWELMPPRVTHLLDFARAYLGSPKLGELLEVNDRVRKVLCGHSHWPARWHGKRGEDWINIGGGYQEKLWEVVDDGE
jgi:Calcineurin-like phosphoesterase